MIHPIEKYLKNTDETQASFAARAGVNRQHLNDVFRTRSQFGNGSVLRVARATRGAVSVEEMLAWSAKVKRARCRR